jgi:hypothetical protein
LRSRKGEKTERIERARAHLNQSCKYLENACSRLLRTESRKKWRVSVGERRHRLQSPCYGDERGGSKEPQTVPTPTPTPTPVQVYIEPNTTTVAPGQQFAVDVSVKGTTAQTVVAEFTFDASKVVYVTKSTYGPFSFVSSVSGNRVSVAGISDTDNFFLERFTSFRIMYTTIVKFLRASSALLEPTDIMVPELKTMTIPFQFFFFTVALH